MKKILLFWRGLLDNEENQVFPFVWLAAILGILVYYKVRFASVQHSLLIDGGLYTDIARHIRDGMGIKTNVSLYHQAFSYFPHESAISPLWPLLYGYVSRFFDIYIVAFWLPTFLYFTALLGCYFWAKRLFPKSIFPETFPGFNAGHIFILMLAVHREFFIFTSVPYTESLAFTVLGVGLWRLHVLLKRNTIFSGLEIGLWLSIMFLARQQFALVVIAVSMALTWALIALPERKQRALQFVSTASVFLALIGTYYWVFVEPFVAQNFHTALLRFDLGYESPILSEFNPSVKTNGLLEFVKDRLGGLLVAFKFSGRFAYARSFHTYQYALVVGVVMAFFMGIKHIKSWKEGLDILRTPNAIPWIMVILFSIGAFTAMYLIHFTYFWEWHFARRQGAPTVFIFFFALIFLLRSQKLWKVAGIFILCTGVMYGMTSVKSEVEVAEKNRGKGPTFHRPQLVKWLNAQGKITVAMSAHEPQRIGHLTPQVGYHWFYDKSTPVDIEILTTKLGAKYVILVGNTRHWRFRGGKVFDEKFKKIHALDGALIYERR